MAREYVLYVTFVASKIILQHLNRDALKNVPTPTVSEFDEILRASYILRDDSNGAIHFVIRDLENKLWIFNRNNKFVIEIMIFPFFQKIGISRVLHSPLLTRNFIPKFRTIIIKHMHMQRALYHACKQSFKS